MPESVMNLARYFVAQADEAALALAGTGIVFAGFWSVGRQLSNSEAWVVTLMGWAALYLVAALAAIAGFTDLSYVLGVPIGLAMIAATFRRFHAPNFSAMWPLVALVTPMLILAALLPSMYWDSYMHWLPNALYMFQTGHFPAEPLGIFPSAHPTYPPGLPLVIYLTSIATGSFSESAGTVTTVLLSLATMFYVREILRTQLPSTEDGILRNMLLSGVSFCIVILLNPAIQWMHYWSTLADPVMAAIVFMVIYKWCGLFTRAAVQSDASRSGGPVDGERRAPTTGQVAPLFMLGVLISALKQSGWEMGIVLTVAGSILGVSFRLRLRQWFTPGLTFLSGTITSHLVWEHYLSRSLPVSGQFSVLPLDKWRLDLAGKLSHAVLAEFIEFWPYYLLVALVVFLGLFKIVRRTDRLSHIDFMICFVAIAFTGHFTSLMAAYLGTGFQDWEIARAASLQRYTSELGFSACIIGLSFIVIQLARSTVARSIVMKPVVAVASAAAFLGLYAYALLYPSLGLAAWLYESRVEARQAAVRMLEATRPGEQVAVIGEDWAVQMTNYSSWANYPDWRRPVVVDMELAYTAENVDVARTRIDGWQRNPQIAKIFVVNAQGLAAALGLPKVPYLFWERTTGQWSPLTEISIRK